MTDHESKFAGTGPVRTGQEISSDTLSVWMRSHVEGFSGPLTIEQFKGGQSNPTYKLRTPGRDYVLRRKPPGQLLKGAHAVDREFRVTSALSGAGFPVARPLALCTDESVIGSWFFIMEMVEGRIFWDSAFSSVTSVDRPAYFEAISVTIAQLHGLNPDAIGLADYAKKSGYFGRQIARWSSQYREDAAAGRLDDMDRLAEWLPNNIPPGDEISVVHGDFRADNVVFHPSEPKVLAVLDWELSTLGHPLADFAYHLMMYYLPPALLGGFAGANLAALNIPSEKDYIAAYCRRTGRAGIDNLNFYLAFSMFRFAAILHGIKGRALRGTAASPHANSMADQLPLMAHLAATQIKF